MFDRYTQRARRVIFFARYEASETGSNSISPEHLLLGVMRENMDLLQDLSEPKDIDTVRAELFGSIPPARTPTNVDLPLTDSAQRVLQHAVHWSEVLHHKLVASCHLLLAILHEPNSSAATLLQRNGIGRDQVLLRIPESLSADDKPPNSQFPLDLF